METHKAAILAALSISDELLQARKELGRVLKETDSRATKLAQRLEAGLASADLE
jgi:cell division protein ZapA (FtsZ GTPase activity inhibitor)